MQLPKVSESDKELFRSVIPDAPTVTIRPMFGSLGAFVNGNMFAALFGSTIGIRVLEDETRAELEAIEGVGPGGPPERPMREYLSLPDAWSSEPELLENWVARSLWEVETLPEKKPKSRQLK